MIGFREKWKIIREGVKDSVALIICSKLFLSEPITITYRYTKPRIFIFEIPNTLAILVTNLSKI